MTGTATVAWIVNQPPAAFSYDAVAFDGASEMTRSSTMADGSQLTVTGFFRKTSAGTAEGLFCTDNFCALLYIDSSGSMTFNVTDSTGAKVFLVEALVSGLDNNAWHSFGISVDTNFAAGSKLATLVIDKSVITPAKSDGSSAFNIGLSSTTHRIGSVAGGNLWAGSLCEMTIKKTYIDWSVSSNVDLFFDVSNKPVDLGTTGATAYGSAADSYNHIPAAGTASDFAIDRGGSTNYTINGTLTLSATKP